MDTDLSRRLKIEAILSYHALIESKGLDVSIPLPDVLDTMSNHDLSSLEHKLRDIARTPSS